MRVAIVLGLLAGIARAECPADANPVQAEWCKAREAVLALPENSIAQAKAWEALAVSQAGKNQATVTGLGGQTDGKPNCAECVAWCWNNAGYAYYLRGQYGDATRCLETALADANISADCKEKAGRTLDAAVGAKAKADRKSAAVARPESK